MKPLKMSGFFYMHKQVIMIGHQAECKDINERGGLLPDLLREHGEVILFPEQFFEPIRMIQYVIDPAWRHISFVARSDHRNTPYKLKCRGKDEFFLYF
jgi:hypothetical protein